MCVGVWVTFYRRFFLWLVDWVEANPKVGLPVENNVVGKSSNFFFSFVEVI